jgi:hypothetical protein
VARIVSVNVGRPQPIGARRGRPLMSAIGFRPLIASTTSPALARLEQILPQPAKAPPVLLRQLIARDAFHQRHLRGGVEHVHVVACRARRAEALVDRCVDLT